MPVCYICFEILPLSMQNSSFLCFGSDRETTENRELCFDIKVGYHNLGLQHTAGGAVLKKAPECYLVGPGAGEPDFLLVSLRLSGREWLIFLQDLFS